MLKLKDVKVGSLVMNTSGIYEITDIDDRTNFKYTIQEVTDDGITGACYGVTDFDLKNMDLIG